MNLKCNVIPQVCAYAGTGNVLKVQEMLQICTDHYIGADTSSKKDKKKQDKVGSEFFFYIKDNFNNLLYTDFIIYIIKLFL